MPEEQSTSWELIRTARDDPGAREAVARQYSPFVRALLARRWSSGPLRQQIEDATQEVFVEFLRSGGVLEKAHPSNGARFRAYLAGVVRNVARRIEERERGRQRREASVQPELFAHPQTSPSRAFDRRELKALLREAAREMERRAPSISESARVRVEILRLRFREDLPIRAIADRLDRDPKWVHHQYAKARTEFGRELRNILRRRTPGYAVDAEAQCMSLLGLFD